MEVPASGSALGALIEHTAAFSSRDNHRYANCLSLPFVHLWPEGDILRYEDPARVDLSDHYARAGLDARNFGRTELNEARLVLDWQRLKAYHVKFTRYAPGGAGLAQSEALWVAVHAGESWKMKLRIGAERPA